MGFEVDAWPAAINDRGAVTGHAGDITRISQDGHVTVVPPPAGYGFMLPATISNSNQVAGMARQSRTVDAGQRAAYFADGVTVALDLAPGGEGSTATDLNDVGQLVGHGGYYGMRSIVGSGRAFRYDIATQTMADLGTVPGFNQSAALAINNLGAVVGFAFDPVSSIAPFTQAVLYDPTIGTMVNLNDLVPADSGWELLQAMDINDTGEIVGRGMIGGQIHAFHLIPNM